MNEIIVIVCALICYFNYKTIQNNEKQYKMIEAMRFMNESLIEMEKNDTKRNI